MSKLGSNKRLVWTAAVVLLVNVVFLGKDLSDDLREGMGIDHVIPEIIVVLISVGVVALLVRETLDSRRESYNLRRQIGQLEAVAEEWRKKTALYSMGLAQAIDEQLGAWNLSAAEKEVSLLLLKGLSNKEIAEIRATSEQTVKQQSSAIYRKSGLTSRSELSAYFLEDLLSPQSQSVKADSTSVVSSSTVETPTKVE